MHFCSVVFLALALVSFAAIASSVDINAKNSNLRGRQLTHNNRNRNNGNVNYTGHNVDIETAPDHHYGQHGTGIDATRNGIQTGIDATRNGIVSGETSQTAKKVVYIIRHGEKIYVPTNETAYKYACLNAEGWSRAYNLVSVFGGHNPQHTKLLRTPQAIFSYNYDNGDLDCRTSNQGYYRTQATVAPLANVLNLAVNNVTGSKPDLCGPSKGTPIGLCWQPKPDGSVHDMGPCCNAGAASRIHTKLMTPAVDSILVSWEHANIKYLVNELTGGKIAATEVSWPDPEFDKVVALYFSAATGEFLTMDQTLTQGFQWLGPTAAGTEDVNLCAGSHPDIN